MILNQLTHGTRIAIKAGGRSRNMKTKLFTLVLLAEVAVRRDSLVDRAWPRDALLLPTTSATGGRVHTAVSWS